MNYVPEPFHQTLNEIRLELNLANYATKPDLNKVTGVDTSKFAKKTDLVGWKLDVDELHVNS